VFEVLVVLGALALLSARPTSRRLARGAVLSSTLVPAPTVTLLTSAAIISFSPHGSAEADQEEQEQTDTGGHEVASGEDGEALVGGP